MQIDERMLVAEGEMDTFVFWCDRPFNPRLISKKGRAIRTRSAILALIALGLLAIILNIVG